MHRHSVLVSQQVLHDQFSPAAVVKVVLNVIVSQSIHPFVSGLCLRDPSIVQQIHGSELTITNAVHTTQHPRRSLKVSKQKSKAKPRQQA
jgi:hypothetical protein